MQVPSCFFVLWFGKMGLGGAEQYCIAYVYICPAIVLYSTTTIFYYTGCTSEHIQLCVLNRVHSLKNEKYTLKMS